MQAIYAILIDHNGFSQPVVCYVVALVITGILSFLPLALG
jgi:hypothetical protein